LESGYPGFSSGGFSGAPYDMLTDMARGTTGIMMDMYRQPNKIHEAMERLVPIVIETAVSGAENSLCPVVMMPLHKGEKGFMSPKQFETFYWPTFKKVLLGIINEGLVPRPPSKRCFSVSSTRGLSPSPLLKGTISPASI